MQNSIILFRSSWVSVLRDITMAYSMIAMYIYIDSKTDNMIFYLGTLGFVATNAFYYMCQNKWIVNLDVFTTSFLVFCIYATLSMLWAPQMQIPAYKLFIVSVAMAVAMMYYLKDINNFNKFLWITVIAGVCLSIKILTYYGGNIFSIGNRIKILNTNANSIGLMLSLSMVSCILIFYRKKRKWFLPLVLYYAVFILLTGSRKALVMAISLVVLMYLVMSQSPYKVLLRILVVIMGIVVLWLILMNVDWAYNAVGHRIESTIYGLFYGENAEDENRMAMIELAWELFKVRPICGNGLDTFRVLNGRFDAYCHSNFFELLADVGVIGSFVYYIRYAVVVKSLNRKDYRIADRVLYWTGIGIVMIMMFYEFAAVSYYSVFFQILFVFGYCCMRLSMYERS